MRGWIMGLAALLALAAPLSAEGPLVIVGGALADDNDAVFGAFLAGLPAPDAPIAIIPAASGVPVQAARAFAAQLERRGVDRQRIRIIRLATEDDPATGEDESRWVGHGDDAAEVARLAGIGGVWLSGGDQARIMAALVRRDGSATAMLAAIRAAHAAGAVIGGTSAGAAIMSDPMIAQGDPLSLMPGPEPGEGAGEAREPILMARGLGFLHGVLVDQHFGERARLPRLAAALQTYPPGQRIGLGIDEDTALVIAGDRQSATIAGRGMVTLLDARAARFAAGGPFAVRGAVVAIIRPGETLDLAAFWPKAQSREQGEPRQPCLSATSAAGLPASQSAMIAAVTGALGSGEEAVCLVSAGEAGLALRFRRDGDKTGDETGDERGGRVRLDIAPVRVRLEPLVP